MNKYLVTAVWGVCLHVLAENQYVALETACRWWTDQGAITSEYDIESVVEVD